MLNIRLCIALFGATLAHAMPEVQGMPPLHVNGKLTEPVQRICAIFNQQEITTIEELNSFAQKNLLRRADSRLGEQEHDMLATMEQHRAELIKQLAVLGLIGRIDPDQKEYEHALVMSHYKHIVKQRMDHLAELIKEGYVFKKIVLMGAELEVESEAKAELPEGIRMQTDMMLNMYAEYECFKGIPVMVVSPGMETRADGSITRPNTDSQYRDLVKKDITPGACLVISNNPHIRRQGEVGKRIIDQSKYPISPTGPAVNPDEHIVTVLDEFARLTYETYQSFRKEQQAQATAVAA